MIGRISFPPMFNTPVRLFLLSLLVLSVPFVPLAAQEETGREQEVIWTPVPGASFYHFELYSGDTLIVETDTTQTRFVTFLNPGEYRYRITVFNKFKKPVSDSGWVTLRVLEALQPVVNRVEPDFLYSNNGGRGDFLMEIQNLEKGATITLFSEQTAIEGRITSQGGNLWRVSFEDPLLETPGVFDLLVANPSGLKDMSYERITVRKVNQPEVNNIVPGLAGSGDILVKVVLNGWGFTPDVKVRFIGTANWSPTAVFFVSSEQLQFNADLTKIPPGQYTVIVESPSGLVGEKTDAFLVIDPEIEDVNDYVINENTGEIRKKRRIDNKLAGIAAGYHYSFMFGSLDRFFDRAPFGADVRLRIPFRNDFFRNVPLLRRMGLDFGINFSLFDISAYGDYTLQVFGFDACLFYKTPFPIFLNFVLKAGAGLTFSRMIGDGLLGTSNSSTLDFQVIAGAGMEISLGGFAWIELGAMGRMQIMLSGSNLYLQPYALIGKYF